MKKHSKNNNINLIANIIILFLCLFIEKLTDSFDPQLGLKRWLVSRQAEDNLHDCQTITRKKFNDIILIGRKRLKICKKFFNLFLCMGDMWIAINPYCNIRVNNHQCILMSSMYSNCVIILM